MTKTSTEWEIYIGEQIRHARVRKGMTQEEVAWRTGLTTPTVSRLETGKGSSLETLVKVVQLLGLERWFETLAPKVSISPIDAKRIGKEKSRKRVRRRK